MIKDVINSLQVVMRYFAAGIVGLLGALYVRGRYELDIEAFATRDRIVALSVVAALVGVSIYSILKGVLGPAIFAIGIGDAPPMHGTWSPLNGRRDQRYELDHWRWQRRASTNPRLKVIQTGLDEWSVMGHFLTSSGIALAIVPAFIAILTTGYTVHGVLPWSRLFSMLFLGMAFACFGLCITVREIHREVYYFNECHTPGEPDCLEAARAPKHLDDDQVPGSCPPDGGD